MALTTVKSIEQALSLVDEKKQSLKQAFEELQSHSSSLSSVDFSWTDIDSYFSHAQSELLDKFAALQALESSQTGEVKSENQKISKPVRVRPELKSLCEEMDALGLRKYVIGRPKERSAIRAELAEAFKLAPDAGSMVLDALQGFWDEKLGSGSRMRTVCVLLLEELMRAGVEIGAEVRERAKAVAAVWKVKMAESNSEGDEEGKEEHWGLERLGYLQLLASYSLLSDGEFDASELVDCVALSARYRQTVDLCRVLGLESRISDVVRRLIGEGKQLFALKFVFEFQLADEYPPVPLLQAYLMDSQKSSQKGRKSGKSSRQSLDDAAMKEITALKSVIKCVEEHGLESQYPKDEMLMCIKKLEKEKADRKRPAAAPKPQQPPKQPKHNGNNRGKAGAAPSAFNRKFNGNSFFRPPQPSSMQRAGPLQGHASPYLGPSSGAYGIAGPIVVAAPYVGSSPDLYGLPGAPFGYSANLNPSTSSSYNPEAHAQPQPGYYNRVVGYGGYDVSSYPPVYYPQ